MSEQAVIVKFRCAWNDLDALHAIEDKLSDAIEVAGAGECDGHEVSLDFSEATFYLFGTNAEELFAIAKNVLEPEAFVLDAIATIRCGAPEGEGPERQVRIK
jgi:hypothetical protein